MAVCLRSFIRGEVRDSSHRARPWTSKKALGDSPPEQGEGSPIFFKSFHSSYHPIPPLHLPTPISRSCPHTSFVSLSIQTHKR